MPRGERHLSETERAERRRDRAASSEGRGVEVKRAGSRRWEPLPQPGVEVSFLHTRLETREAAFLVRMERGASLPFHGHPGGEHILMLEGAARVGGTLLGAGDFHYTPPGHCHEVIAESSCLLFSLLPRGGHGGSS